MKIEHTQPGRADDVVAQDVAVSHDEPKVRRKVGELRARAVGQFFRLKHRQAPRLGPGLDRVGLHFLPAAHGTIRLGKHAHHLRDGGTLARQPVEDRPGNRIRPEKYDA